SWDGRVNVWDTTIGQEVFTSEEHRGTIVPATPEARRIVSGSPAWPLEIKDAETGHAVLFFWKHAASAGEATVSTDGKRVLIAWIDNTLRLLDAKSGKGEVILKGHTDMIRSACFSPYGRSIASASADGTVRVWDAATGEEKAIIKGHEKP